MGLGEMLLVLFGVVAGGPLWLLLLKAGRKPRAVTKAQIVRVMRRETPDDAWQPVENTQA